MTEGKESRRGKGEKRKARKAFGCAYLVGAGPGDPGLITVRGRELLQSADAIVYDALANPELLRLPRAEGSRAPEMHDVGKRGGDPGGSERQDAINELLVQLVRQGKQVVRLKGGDPFVFGRGGEEAQRLAEAGLPFEIVPGVTAGIAAPAYAGIPVTHRGLATSVTLVTGHEDPMKGAPQADWNALARSGGTIVLYMGIKKLPEVAKALIAGGMPGEIPAAAIQWGTRPQQKTVVATLESLAQHATAEGIQAPAIIVIGWTVVLREEIAWFDRKPLFGEHIIVARAGDSSGDSKLAARLREHGAEVWDIASTRLVPLPSKDSSKLLEQLADFGWVVFTSANAVEFFWRALESRKLDSRALGAAKVAAVGPATSAALKQRGIVVDVQARRFAAEGLVDAMSEHGSIQGERILYPCAEGARPTLEIGLAELGASVERVNIYRSEPDKSAGEEIERILEGKSATLAAFTSASSVRAFIAAAGIDKARAIRAASIGPTTTESLREAGMNVVAEAQEATIDGLVRAILLVTAGEEN